MTAVTPQSVPQQRLRNTVLERSLLRAFDLHRHSLLTLCDAILRGRVVLPWSGLALLSDRQDARSLLLHDWLRASGMPPEWIDQLCRTLRPEVAFLAYEREDRRLVVEIVT